MPALWSFSEMERHDVDRATRLRASPSWLVLVHRISDSLHKAIAADKVRFGFDESSRDARHLRAVVQFPIGRELFDYFFNGHGGYRAQFRIGRANGLTKNAELISEVNAELSRSITSPITARRLSQDFVDKGPMTATVKDLTSSLDPSLSKVWICEKLISPTGEIQSLFVSRTGPELTFEDSDRWKSFYAEDADGWLDVKGAFVSPEGDYQLKSPADRAAKLEQRGSA